MQKQIVFTIGVVFLIVFMGGLTVGLIVLLKAKNDDRTEFVYHPQSRSVSMASIPADSETEQASKVETPVQSQLSPEQELPEGANIRETPGPAITSMVGYPEGFHGYSHMILQIQADKDRVTRWSQYSQDDWDSLVAGFNVYRNIYLEWSPASRLYWKAPEGNILRHENGDLIIAIAMTDDQMIECGREHRKVSTANITPSATPVRQESVESGYVETEVPLGTSTATREEFLRSEIKRLQVAIENDERLLNKQGWGATLVPLLGDVLSLAVENSTNEFDKKYSLYASPALDLGSETLGQKISNAKQQTEQRLSVNRELLKAYQAELK